MLIALTRKALLLSGVEFYFIFHKIEWFHLRRRFFWRIHRNGIWFGNWKHIFYFQLGIYRVTHFVKLRITSGEKLGTIFSYASVGKTLEKIIWYTCAWLGESVYINELHKYNHKKILYVVNCVISGHLFVYRYKTHLNTCYYS